MTRSVKAFSKSSFRMAASSSSREILKTLLIEAAFSFDNSRIASSYVALTCFDANDDADLTVSSSLPICR